jgi:CheY-like chemotaxis protein
MIIAGNVETAQRSALEIGKPNLDRALKNALRGAHRAASLTQRLLAFSRQQALDPKALDLKTYLTDAREFLQRSLGETIEIETVCAKGVWSVEIDPNQLEIALLNLSINARDAMPHGGKLTLEAENTFLDREYCRANPEVNPGQYVVLSVSDTGMGMNKEVLNRAFEPFFTTKEPGRGTGLGLSQVYGFIKQSGGHARIYSEMGHGTTIKMYLPRFVGSGARDEQPRDEISLRGAKGEVILLTEDDDDLRAYLTDALRALGYTVLTAVSAEAALKLVEQTDLRIDLVLTDLVMPKMDGRELAKRARSLRPDLAVVYMTGYPRHALAVHGRLDAKADVLQKPISQSGLATGIRKALDRR